jgi:uncharacterized protein (UPF0297 family)
VQNNPTLDIVTAMSEERFLAVYEALSEQGFGPLDGEVARALKFRPQAIRKLPFEQRAKQARKIIERTRNADLAYELLGGYLMKTSRELVTDFLDATGVTHDEGMIEEGAPDEDKVEAALSTLDGKYPAEDVTLYLALSTQTWPGSEKIAALYAART